MSALPDATPAELQTRDLSRFLAQDCRGLNFYEIDPALRQLLGLRLPEDLNAFLQPHLARLGKLAGGRMDELAAEANRHGPVLHPRDRYGRDEEWIEHHPAYRELERIAYTEFGIHAMSRTEGVMGWPARFLPLAKYAFQYLFVQAEFGLVCPIAMTDSAIFILQRHADAALKERLLPRLLLRDAERMFKATHLMTEKPGGSDVGRVETRAVREGDAWRLYGDKWFCSAADADVALVLARPSGAPGGTRGLGLFAMPRRLDDGQRNAYRITRLKDKLGTRSMPTGEILIEGARAYLVGDVTQGLKHILEQVNLARLSHGVRAAGMMRRCLNEAMVAARTRVVFGKPGIAHPLQRRQLLKIMVPTEQALSMVVHAADTMRRAEAGATDAELELRVLTPMIKLRACRDNIKVATASMEIRGGNGFIEDHVNERLVRDAQTGLLWEGTSNIVALDLVNRAAGKKGGHRLLGARLETLLGTTEGLPASLAGRLLSALRRSVASLDDCMSQPAAEAEFRRVGSLFYHCVSACLLACEGIAIGHRYGDARRLLLAKLVLDHRVEVRDPFVLRDSAADAETESLLLDAPQVPLARAQALV